MSDLYWLTDEQMARLEPYFPKSHGKPRVDDRRVLSGIVFVNRNGLRWCDAPKEYGPHKTLYNRWKRWGEMRVPRFLIQSEGEFPAFMRVSRFLIQSEGEFPAFIRPL
jgi:transposase